MKKSEQVAMRRHASIAGADRAEVLEVVDDDSVLLRLRRAPTEEVLRAEIAVLHYEPQEGDRVLVLGDEDGAFVVGVLGDARRRVANVTPLAGGKLVASYDPVHGVALHAGETELTVSSTAKVSIQSERAELRATHAQLDAGRFELRAERVFEHAGSSYRHADDLAQTTAKRSRLLVEGECEVSSGRTSIRSEADTIVDGRRVLLG